MFDAQLIIVWEVRDGLMSAGYIFIPFGICLHAFRGAAQLALVPHNVQVAIVYLMLLICVRVQWRCPAGA